MKNLLTDKNTNLSKDILKKIAQHSKWGSMGAAKNKDYIQKTYTSDYVETREAERWLTPPFILSLCVCSHCDVITLLACHWWIVSVGQSPLESSLWICQFFQVLDWLRAVCDDTKLDFKLLMEFLWENLRFAKHKVLNYDKRSLTTQKLSAVAECPDNSGH